MTRVNNPRFPHTCRILRRPESEPMTDQPGTVTDVTDDPMTDDPMADAGEQEETQESEQNQEQQETNEEASEEQSEEQSQDVTVLYEGVCRGYNRDTTSDNGDVNASYRYLALPLKQDEWTDQTIPREGDKVVLHKFGYTEYGQIIDIRPSNLGTHILWKYVRN